MVDQVVAQKKKRVNITVWLLTCIVIVMGVVLLALVYDKKTNPSARDWFWVFVVIVGVTIVIMYMLIRKGKTWNPIKVIKEIDSLMAVGGYKLNTLPDSVEVHYSSNSPAVRLFYFKNNKFNNFEIPLLVAWNMNEERIDAFYVRNPDRLNKFFEDSKRLDVEWSKDKLAMERELKNIQEGIISVPEDQGGSQ